MLQFSLLQGGPTVVTWIIAPINYIYFPPTKPRVKLVLFTNLANKLEHRLANNFPTLPGAGVFKCSFAGLPVVARE
jgi:hypothetical protein